MRYISGRHLSSIIELEQVLVVGETNTNCSETIFLKEYKQINSVKSILLWPQDFSEETSYIFSLTPHVLQAQFLSTSK